MTRLTCILLLAFAGGGLIPASAAESDVVFRTDVSLVRVDAQVVDHNNRAITGLRAEDFLLREEGRPQQIRNFASEEMPLDVLLLLDVSASMRPHVERIASASHQALRILRDQDRVAIMVFDRATRVRLPFRNSREDVEREFERLLRQETFHGGTDITRALIDAAKYIGREGRRDARRAIVILTDDQTELNRDEEAVGRALTRADAVLSALIAPDAMGTGSWSPGRGGGGRSWPGGGWPGGPMGGPLGGIILGRRGPYGGRGPGPVMRGPRTQSAGTAEIARRSGGDSMPVEDASALETTLARLRQRYALHFYLPEGVKPGEERSIEVDLAQAARRRYPDAEVRYRRVYLAQGGVQTASVTSPEPAVVKPGDDPPEATEVPKLKRRPAVDPDSARPREGPLTAESQGGWRRVDEPAAQASPSDNTPTDQQPRSGWRRLKPGEQP